MNRTDNFPVIFENTDFIAIDKPAGINSDDIPMRAHRLDKDTSGVLLIAKNEETLQCLQKQFQERKIQKKYTALAIGHLQNKSGVIDTLIGRSPNDRRKQKIFQEGEPGSEGKREAKSTYEVLKSFENYDLIEIKPLTGRKHQIRAQMTFLGHPLAGDKLYGFKNQPCPSNLKRQFLHASWLKISFKGQDIEITSHLPRDLQEVLDTLT